MCVEPDAGPVRPVDNVNDRIGSFDNVVTAINTNPLDDSQFPQCINWPSSGISQDHCHSVKVKGLFKRVACGPGFVSDDCPGPIQQGIEKAAFASIWRPDDCDTPAVAPDATRPCGTHQRVNLLPQRVDARSQDRSVNGRNIIVRKIKCGLKFRINRNQVIPDQSDGACQRTGQMVDGHLDTCAGRGTDRVEDGLGLREINASAKKRAQRELTSVGRSCPGTDHGRKHRFRRREASMAHDLEGRLTGIRTGTGHVDRHYLVDLLSSISVDYPSQGNPPRHQLARPDPSDNAPDDCGHVRPTHSHNCDGALAMRGRNCDDGVARRRNYGFPKQAFLPHSRYSSTGRCRHHLVPNGRTMPATRRWRASLADMIEETHLKRSRSDRQSWMRWVKDLGVQSEPPQCRPSIQGYERRRVDCDW